MAKVDLTAQRLRELLTYDPETGLFTNRIQRGPNGRIGARVGYPQTSGHIQIRIDGVKYMAHRLAWLYMTGEWPTMEIDHINRVRTDNRIANLRDVSRAFNTQNIKVANGNNKSTGLRGAHADEDGRWVAHLRTHGANLYLGVFATPEEAPAAYVAAKRIHHPGFSG